MMNNNINGNILNELQRLAEHTNVHYESVDVGVDYDVNWFVYVKVKMIYVNEYDDKEKELEFVYDLDSNTPKKIAREIYEKEIS